MAKDHQLSIMVSMEQKARWEQYATDAPDVDSLAQLVRQSVELYIHTEGGKELLGSQGGDVGALETGVNGIKNKLDSLERSINAIQQEVEADEINLNLQKAIYRALPTQQELRSGSDTEVVIPGVTAEELAEQMPETVEEVEKALKNLDEISPEIKSLHRADEKIGKVTVYHRKR